MRVPLICLAMVGAATMFLGGCSTAPTNADQRTQLQTDSDAAVNDFKAKDPSLDRLLRSSYGYAIFPTITKGAVGVGGAFGHGQVYQQGNRIGYADMSQASVGAALGGQDYAELLVFRTPEALQRFESGQTTFEADASAAAITGGAADNARWSNDVAVFTNIKGGLMADVAIGGQHFSYQPL
jgi:lipid-binding SYLF domain-containing protein